MQATKRRRGNVEHADFGASEASARLREEQWTLTLFRAAAACAYWVEADGRGGRVEWLAKRGR